ncbi:MAG: hypothetical protein IPJ97_18640 [Proteobacteria bacterium]|nr:hypothetical protein [Pseudomonadota bacterium]
MAGSLTGKFMIGKDDIRFMLLGGNLGRYVGLNFTTDAVLTSNTGTADLETIDGFAGSIAYRHVWSDKWRSSIYFALKVTTTTTPVTPVAMSTSQARAGRSTPGIRRCRSST